HAGHRRRVRPQGDCLRRGYPRAVPGPRARPAGPLRRDTARASAGGHAGARPVARRRGRLHARGPDRRGARHVHARLRRLRLVGCDRAHPYLGQRTRAVSRRAGRPQAAFVMERMLDLAAARLRIGRVRVRERNLIQPDEFPYDVGLISRDNSPRRYDSGNYPECLRRVAEAIGAANFTEERERAREAGRAIGLGFALFVEDTGLGPYEGIRVRVDPLGHVFVSAGTSSQGQAHETTLAQVVADGLSVPLEQVTVIPGDTAGIPFGVGTFASRVGVLASTSAAHAAAEV